MYSKSKLTSAAKTMEYHRDAFEQSIDSPEASQGERVTAVYAGKGAAMAGLTGTPQAADVDRLLRGIIAGQSVQHGFDQDTGAFKHSPGFDLTYSPDKTVCIAAGVQGDDERISKALLASAAIGVEYAEANGAFVQDRDGEHNTGNVVALLVLHKTTRMVDGHVDPQYHVHTLFFNITFDGRTNTWRAVDFRTLISPEFRKEMDRVTGAAMNGMLQSFGYETEPSKNGLGSAIKGYTDEQVAEFSGRSVLQRDPELARKGIDPATASQAEKQFAILAKREDKSLLPWSEIQADWHERGLKVGLELNAAPGYTPPDQERVNAAASIVIDALTHNVSDAVALREDLHNREDVKAAVNELKDASTAAEPLSVFTWNKEIRGIEPEATREQIKSATAEVLDSGELHKHENGKYSSEPEKEYNERKQAEGEKIERVTYQQVADEVAKAVAGMSAAQERYADLRQQQRDLEKVMSPEQARSLQDDIKATRDASSMTNKGIAASVRENLKYAKTADIEKAITALVDSDVLTAKGVTNKSGEAVRDKQGNQLTAYTPQLDEARMYERASAAFEKVLSAAERAREDVQSHVADMQAVTDSRDYRRAGAIAENIRGAEKVMSSTAKGWHYQVSQAAPGASKEMVQGLIDRAVSAGRLHSQVGRLSVETEAQTDRRLSQVKALTAKGKSVDRAVKQAERKQDRKEQAAERKQERKDRQAAYDQARDDRKKARIGMSDVMKVKLTGKVYLLDNWLTASTRDQAKYKAIDWRLAVVVKAIYATVKAGQLTGKLLIGTGRAVRGAYRLNKAVAEHRADKKLAGTLEPLKERQQVVADYLIVAESKQAYERAQKNLDGFTAEKAKLTKALETAKAQHELIKAAGEKAGEQKTEQHNVAEKLSEAKVRAAEQDLAHHLDREQKATIAAAEAKYALVKAEEKTAGYGHKDQPEARHSEQLRGEHARISAAMEKAQGARNKLDAGERERAQEKSRYINATRGGYTFGEGMSQRRAAFTPSAIIGHLMVHSGNKTLGDIGIKMTKVSTVRDPWERAISVPLATFSKSISVLNKGYAAVAERVAARNEVTAKDERIAVFAAAMTGDKQAAAKLETMVADRHETVTRAAAKAEQAWKTGKGSEYMSQAADRKENRVTSQEALDKLAQKHGKEKWDGESYSKLLTSDLTTARKLANESKDSLRVAERDLKSAEKAGTATTDQHVAVLAAKDNADKLSMRAEAVAIVQRQWLDVDTRQFEKINTAVTDHKDNSAQAATVAAGKTQDLSELYKRDTKTAEQGKDKAWFADGPQPSAVTPKDVEQMTEKLRGTPAANDPQAAVDSWKAHLRGEGPNPAERPTSPETKAQADAIVVNLRESGDRAVEAAVAAHKAEQKQDGKTLEKSVEQGAKAEVINISAATKEKVAEYADKLRKPGKLNAAAQQEARAERNLAQTTGRSLDEVGRGREAAAPKRRAASYSF
ncbi:MobF family relaxase [Quatrionicoccus australiensis]|uniref:MobF family relaxase n=1 Tax=Quatrionicoccus australiensis TaxID=138118 RepID=UPI001CFB42B9|nr:MobF family relaxase [Quatrionicoccus australiensis]MCB4359584.1 relaxase domain-containing protein [Quatrionicoccus australiensis]